MVFDDDMMLLCLFLLPSPGVFVSLHLQQTAIAFPHLQQINIMQEGSLDSIIRRKLLQGLE